MGLQQKDWSRRENSKCPSDTESPCQSKQEKAASFPVSKLLQPLLQNGPFAQPFGCPRHPRGLQASFAAFWFGDNPTWYSCLDCPSGSWLEELSYMDCPPSFNVWPQLLQWLNCPCKKQKGQGVWNLHSSYHIPQTSWGINLAQSLRKCWGNATMVLRNSSTSSSFTDFSHSLFYPQFHTPIFISWCLTCATYLSIQHSFFH